MKHLTKRHYGHHIGKGCGLGITVPESGSGHGFKEPQRGVWHRRKWTTEDVGVEQRCEYLRPLPYDILELFFALEYIGFTLSEIHKMLLPDPCRRVPTRCAAVLRAFVAGQAGVIYRKTDNFFGNKTATRGSYLA